MKDLSARFPVWFCDIWGVVHDGYKPFTATIEALAHHRADGGTVILVTNAPRTAPGVAQQLGQIGVAENAYDEIVTSGDVTRNLIVEQGGAAIFHLGPPRDNSIFKGLDVKRVEIKNASSVLCTGLFDERTETPADYLPMLTEMKQRGLKMICANPDKVVRKGAHLIYCAGALAEEFSKIGGTVLMAGKPFAPIYELAMSKAAKLGGQTIKKNQILAIGDGPETDIMGAANFGLACVLITGGINSGADILNEVKGAVPNAQILLALPELDWT
jgi:HAD superfamily hydrolase (TIGR01459 family)